MMSTARNNNIEHAYVIMIMKKVYILRRLEENKLKSNAKFLHVAEI
jgi:hypothetical protein